MCSQNKIPRVYLPGLLIQHLATPAIRHCHCWLGVTCLCQWLPLIPAWWPWGECPALPSPFCPKYEPGCIHFWGLLIIKYRRLGSLGNRNLFFLQSQSLEVWDQGISGLFSPEAFLLGLQMSCLLVSSLRITCHGLPLCMSVSQPPLLIRTPVTVD